MEKNPDMSDFLAVMLFVRLLNQIYWLTVLGIVGIIDIIKERTLSNYDISKLWREEQ
ncbi:hypothetical protein J43TS9_65920 [Paenibacillus cineris]|nr:hypothetical protein J43TS9_65920 [Paenibacillus cineris]